ncbi:NUDIX domain-containing protein [Patescibacteria group bacterium]|nr:NUDIX domain-containing protein [Patescibacteria group bacterium]MBU2265272.1 NUDIX domain-containing protein [Patescibacteria group bacterium]
MRFARSAGAVIFYRSSEGQIEYLLLNHGESQKKSDIAYWNFPKGGIEKGESEIEAAKREVREETGLFNLDFLPKFKKAERYFCRGTKPENLGKLIFKTAIFYLAEAENKEIKISSEHINYEWLPLEQALERMKIFKASRKVLIKADKFLHDYLAAKSLLR